MPRPSSGRKPYTIRLLPATVEAHRRDGESDSDVIRALIADGITHRMTKVLRQIEVRR